HGLGGRQGGWQLRVLKADPQAHGPGRGGGTEAGERGAVAPVLQAARSGWVQPSAPLPQQLMTTMDPCQAAAGQRAHSSFRSGCQHYNEMSSEREMTFKTSRLLPKCPQR
ncbi:unnamed protein product, partial [Gulo gulo]